MIPATPTVATTATARKLKPENLTDYGFLDTPEGLQIHGLLIPAKHDPAGWAPGWGHQTKTGLVDPKYLTPTGQRGYLVFVRQTRLKEIAPSRPNPRILVVTEGAIDAATAAAGIYRTLNVVGAHNDACMSSESFAVWLTQGLAPFYQITAYDNDGQPRVTGPEKVVVLADNDLRGVKAARALAANISAIDPTLEVVIRTPDMAKGDISDYHVAGGENGPINLKDVTLTDTNEGQTAQQKLPERAAAAKTKTHPARRESYVNQTRKEVLEQRKEVLKQAKQQYTLERALLDAGAIPAANKKRWFHCFNLTGHEGGTDKNPSLSITEDGEHFRCWTCKIEGDQVSVAEIAYGDDFIEARKRTVATAGLTLPKAASHAKRYDKPGKATGKESLNYAEFKAESSRSEWLDESAFALADYDKHWIPAYGLIGKHIYRHDTQHGWLPVATLKALYKHVAKAMRATMPRGHKYRESRMPSRDIEACIKRLLSLDLLPEHRDLLKAEVVLFNLLTLKESRGMPWSEAIGEVVEHDTNPRVLWTPIDRRFVTPGGRAERLRYIPPEGRPEPHKLMAFLLWTARGNPELARLTAAMLGRALLADRGVRALPVMIGRGNNGKSVVIRLLKELLGAALTVAGDLHKVGGRFWYGTHAAGAQLLMIPDLNKPPTGGQARAQHDKGVSVLRSVSGGYDDALQVEVKYGAKGLTVNPGITAIVASNHNPHWIRDADDSDALRQRIIPLPFLADIEADGITPNPRMALDIIEADGDSVIASYLVDEYLRWLKDDKPMPEVAEQRLSDIVQGSIPSEAHWVSKRLTQKPGGNVVNIDGYADYEAYAQYKEWPEPQNQRTFRTAITKAVKQYHPDTVIKRTKRKGVVVQIWQGLTLKPATGEYETFIADNERYPSNGF